MKYFSVFLGTSRIEFSVIVENNMYLGKINDLVLCQGSDYESVRSAILDGIEFDKNDKTVVLH